MIKSSIEKLAGNVGYDIAFSNDEVQADLINGLCKGLENSMSESDLETQLCYIAEHLNKKSERVLKALVEFINLKNIK